MAGVGREVWLKRDDRTSDVYGGGKVRKLEWLLANPPYDDDAPIWSVGGVGSHHLVALSLFLRAAGRELHALTFDQVLTRHVVTNLGVLASTGTSLWHVRTRVRLPWAWLAYRLWRRPSRGGRYLTPGASTGVGSLGFVAAGLELGAQIGAGELPRPAAIFIAAGTAGTGAGLVLGLALAGVSTHVRMVSSVEPIAFNRFMFRRKLVEVFAELVRRGLRPEHATGGPAALLRRAEVTWSIDHGQVGDGYGVPTPAAERAVAEARAQGIQLETTYTGKCVAGLVQALEGIDGPWSRGPVLMWNTHAGNDLRSQLVPGWPERLPEPLRDAVRALDGVDDLVGSAT